MDKSYWNSYVAGIVLGLVLLFSFVVTGRGLGASGAFKHVGAAVLHSVNPTWAEENKAIGNYFGPKKSPLDAWIIFVAIGTILGGWISTVTAGRFKMEVIKGPRVSTETRLFFALLGGILSGFAANMARGCTSGQALSGGAQLSLGSWLFMFSIFAGAYAVAYFIRKQWI